MNKILFQLLIHQNLLIPTYPYLSSVVYFTMFLPKSFYSLYWNNNWWKNLQIISWSCFLVSCFPKDIIFNHGPQFRSKFWKGFFELLNVEVKLSTTFHPQTNELKKKINQLLKQYLHYTIDYHQNNWSNLLTMVDFS